MFDRIRQSVDLAKFKADQLVRINRLQGEVASLRREIHSVRGKIADAAIKLHKQSALSQPELEELCAAIDQLKVQITEKETQIAGIRAEVPRPVSVKYTPPSSIVKMNPCPNCGFDAPFGAVFCPDCGNTMPGPSEEQPSTGIAASSSECSNCGFTLPAEAAFCPDCGQPVTGTTQSSEV